MEKPVRIVSTERIKTFNHKVSHGLEHALNFILAREEGSQIKISDFDPFLMPIDTYITSYKKKSIMLKIKSDHDFQGELYWFFEMPTAITLGAIMRMLPEPTLLEKLKALNFEPEDADAFGEVGNQLGGILDRAFRSLTNKNIHLTLDFEKKVYPDEKIQLSSFLNAEEYVVLLNNITVPKFGSQKITLLLPRSLYEIMLNLELDLDGIVPQTTIFHTSDQAFADQMRKKINGRYRKLIFVEKADEILTKLDDPKVSGVALDFGPLTFPLQLNDSILFKRMAANKTLAKKQTLITWANPSDAGVAALTALGLRGATTKSMKDALSPFIESLPIPEKPA